MVSPAPSACPDGVAARSAAASAAQQLSRSAILMTSSALSALPSAAATPAAGNESKPHPSTPGGSARKIDTAASSRNQENDSWLVNTPKHRPSRYYGGVPFAQSAITASNASARSKAGGGAGAAMAGGRSRRWDESEHAPFSSLQQLLRSVGMGSSGDDDDADFGVPTSAAASNSIAWQSTWQTSCNGSSLSVVGRGSNDDGDDDCYDDAAGSVGGNLSAKRSVKRTISHCLGSATGSSGANLMSPPSPVEIKPRGIRKKKTKKKT